jgi:predicted secreted Zn-dependent protease
MWLLVCGLASGEPAVNLQTKYYHITGQSVRELRHSMSGQRPKGQTHDALTTWNISYTYSWQQVNGGVVIQNPKVSVTIITTLPNWSAPKDADPLLVERWRTYLRALQHHENGHASIGTQAAREVEKHLGALPRQPNVEALKQAIETTSQQIIAAAREREKQFDLQTQHGMKHGARFP